MHSRHRQAEVSDKAPTTEISLDVRNFKNEVPTRQGSIRKSEARETFHRRIVRSLMLRFDVEILDVVIRCSSSEKPGEPAMEAA